MPLGAAGHLRALRKLRHRLPGQGQEHAGPELSGGGRKKGAEIRPLHLVMKREEGGG